MAWILSRPLLGSWADISGDTLVSKSRLDGLLVVSRGVVDILVMLLYNIPDLYYTIYSLFNDDAFHYR